MYGFIGIGVCAAFSIMMISSSLAANPYNMRYVDFFDHKRINAQDQESGQTYFDFREPMIAADGSVTYYTAPSAVLKLLEVPTPENARAYIAWQKQKLSKISKAQQMIEQVMKEQIQQ